MTAVQHITIKTEEFSLTVHKDVIREAGWIRADEPEEVWEHCTGPHCDDEDGCTCTPGDVYVEVLERFHNDNHQFTVRFCDESPCKEFRTAGLLEPQ